MLTQRRGSIAVRFIVMTPVHDPKRRDGMHQPMHPIKQKIAHCNQKQDAPDFQHK